MIRFVIAVLAAGAAAGAALIRVDAVGALALQVIAFLAVAAAGAGFFAARRAAIAGALVPLVGLALRLVADDRLADGGDASAPYLLALWTYGGLAIAPVVLVSAISGWVGGWIRGRIVRR